MDRRLILAFSSFLIFFLMLLPINIHVISSTDNIIIYHQSGGGIILDKLPEVTYPHDLVYVYLGKNHFNLTLINLDYNYNFTYVEQKFNAEFGRANITFSYHTMWVNISKGLYKITKLNRMMWGMAKDKYPNTELVLVFTSFQALKIIDKTYIVIGSAYVQNHTAYVFNSVIPEDERVYVGMHEVGHLLGLLHTDDYNDIMYPVYHGQTHFGDESINRLIYLHTRVAS